jgi:hypothetical protein
LEKNPVTQKEVTKRRASLEQEIKGAWDAQFEPKKLEIATPRLDTVEMTASGLYSVEIKNQFLAMISGVHDEIRSGLGQCSF